jgi:intraflagellar transport protein 140
MPLHPILAAHDRASAPPPQAIAIFERNPTPTVAFCIAEGLEETGQVQEAITFYGHAKCPDQGIRLAKEHQLDSELGRLALQGSPDSMEQVARYFEGKGDLQKAITLYHRAGVLGKAIELCMQSLQFGILQEIARSFGAHTDPALLRQLTAFFLNHQQYDKVVYLLFLSQKFNEVGRRVGLRVLPWPMSCMMREYAGC